MNDLPPLSTSYISSLVKACFGTECQLTGIQKLTGGTRKKVYKIETRHPYPSLVLMVWHNQQDYFNEQNETSIQSDKQAPLLYKANSELIHQYGIRIPETYIFDNTLQQIPHAFALTEFIRGVSFNEYKKSHSRNDCLDVLNKISNYLNELNGIARNQSGTLLDKCTQPLPCHKQALEIAFSDLDNLSGVFEGICNRHVPIRSRLEILSQNIQSRNEYHFIHGELGPDEHLMIDEHGEIVIIDIDGCHFHDTEREHSYLKLRFGEDYSALKMDGLDMIRMDFYELCLYISVAHGHYRLFIQGFPEPKMLQEIYEWSIAQIFRILDNDQNLVSIAA